MNEMRAKEAGVEYSVWTEEFRMNDRGLAEGDATGKIKLLLDARERPSVCRYSVSTQAN